MAQEGDALMTKSRLVSIASAVAACALAAYAGLFLLRVDAVWHPVPEGRFGFVVDTASGRVIQVVARSPADRAGLKVGDWVDRPQPLRERLLLVRWVSPSPGERISLETVRHGVRRPVTMSAGLADPSLLAHSPSKFAKEQPLSGAEVMLQTLEFAIIVVVGVVLVLVRPSKMTWGFYLISLTVVFEGSAPWFRSYLPARWSVAELVVENVVLAAGVAGFLVFCIRFPADAPTGWRSAVDRSAPYLFVGYALLGASVTLAPVFWRWPTPEATVMFQVMLLFDFAVALFGAGILLVTYFGARGLERYRMNWVVLGFVTAAIVFAANLLRWVGVLNDVPSMVFIGLNFLYIATPLTVAYAVIRHRVIELRLVASRSLAFGFIASIIFAIFAAVDWFFSTRLPATRFEAAVYAALALLIGFSLNAVRAKIGDAVDFLFFRKWFQARERARVIGDAMRRADLPADLYEPLTTDTADVFSLASAALFEATGDGGFVRVAANGWPARTVWHLLPDDPLVNKVHASPRASDLDSFVWQEPGPPSGAARPALMVPIVVGKRVPAMLFYGSHENGTGLAPDEIRTLRSLTSDASLVYGRQPPKGLQLSALETASV